MERRLILTKDGSHSIEIPEMNVTYHSIHGAIQESLHVFIDAGLKAVQISPNSVLEILEFGFGTGLNALLTVIEAEKSGMQVRYTSLETSALGFELIRSLNYSERLGQPDLQEIFELMHQGKFDEPVSITPNFELYKSSGTIDELSTKELFDLVYFDAFAPAAQPELWTSSVFKMLNELMRPGAILVTYCSKGDVRRAMTSAGFKVEKLKGPPGKREMLRATKRAEE